MRVISCLLVSVFAVSFAARATMPQRNRLAAGRCGIWQKACGVGRRASLRFSAHRSFRDARWRHNQAGLGAWRLGRLQAHAWRRHGDGRSRPPRIRNQSCDGQVDRRRRSRSRPFIITCCAPILRPSTCMSAATAIRRRWRPSFVKRWRASKTPLSTPAAAGPPPAVDLDTAKLDQIIGAQRPDQTAASINLVCCARTRLSRMICQLRPQGRWGWQPQLTFSRRAMGKPPLLATLS